MRSRPDASRRASQLDFNTPAYMRNGARCCLRALSDLVRFDRSCAQAVGAALLSQLTGLVRRLRRAGIIRVRASCRSSMPRYSGCALLLHLLFARPAPTLHLPQSLLLPASCVGSQASTAVHSKRPAAIGSVASHLRRALACAVWSRTAARAEEPSSAAAPCEAAEVLVRPGWSWWVRRRLAQRSRRMSGCGAALSSQHPSLGEPRHS